MKKFKGKKLSTREVQRLVERCRPEDATYRIVPHGFRHSFCTEAAMTDNVNMSVIQKLAGHLSITSTQTYTKVYDNDVMKGYKRIVASRLALAENSKNS